MGSHPLQTDDGDSVTGPSPAPGAITTEADANRRPRVASARDAGGTSPPEIELDLRNDGESLLGDPEQQDATQSPEPRLGDPEQQDATQSPEPPLGDPEQQDATQSSEPPPIPPRLDSTQRGALDDSRKTIQRRASESIEHQITATDRSIVMSLKINLYARLLLYVVAVFSLVVVLFILVGRGGFFVDVRPERSLSVALFEAGWPFLVAITTSVVAVGLAVLLQSRSSSEFGKSLEQVGRLRRESYGGGSRTQALTQVLEETLVNARQAFSLQLWISRALFIVGILLILSFVVSLFAREALVGGGSLAASILAFAGSAVLNPQRQVSSDLAAVTQLQVILGGYVRQASLLEEHIYQVMDLSVESGQPEKANTVVSDGIDRLTKLLGTASKNLESQIFAREKMTDREAWLFRQLLDDSATTNDSDHG